MNKFGFIVPSCVRTRSHLETLLRCLNSIRNFYEKIFIIVILDFTSDVKLLGNLDYNNIIIEYNLEEKVPADMIMYKYFYEKEYFEKAIFIQDSMQILRPFGDLDKIKDFSYIWHFTNHRIQWHTITEPETEYNIKNNIKVHDDLVIDCIKKNVLKDDVKMYMLNKYNKKDEWSGCFGCLTIMSHKFLHNLENSTNIIETMKYMNDNRKRRAIESIFSLACQFETKNDIHTSFDGLYYDGFTGNNMQTSLIIKESHNRQ